MSCNIINIDNKTTAIICGSPSDHVCNEKGSIVYEFTNGFIGTLFDMCKSEKLNLNMCDSDKLYFLQQRDINILSGSVSCSICGRPAIMDAWKM